MRLRGLPGSALQTGHRTSRALLATSSLYRVLAFHANFRASNSLGEAQKVCGNHGAGCVACRSLSVPHDDATPESYKTA
jgi:hypothetical protein